MQSQYSFDHAVWRECNFLRRSYWLILIIIFVFMVISEWILPSTRYFGVNNIQPDRERTSSLTAAGRSIYQRLNSRQSQTVLKSSLISTCTPRKSIVFAKTHKTGGSTVGSIIARYGYERNLSFALPRKGTIIGTKTFDPNMLASVGTQGRDRFQILFNHVPFDRAKIEEVMRPEAKFITILREPVSHFYSAVSYFELMTSNDPNTDVTAISTKNLKQLFRNISSCRRYRCRVTYNGQAFDLGVFPNDSNDSGHYYKVLVKLEKSFDLVMIREYFDESLLLLKSMMCWDFIDILYSSKKVSRGSTSHGTKEQGQMIRSWNFADLLIYEYFKRVIENKIDEGGTQFQRDLLYFRQLNRNAAKFCFDKSSRGRELPAFITNNSKIFCPNLERDVKPYTLLLQHVQRLGW